MYFVPQFTEATDIITLESVIFPMKFCVYIKKFIASSSNNIFYIQIHHFTQQTMLNQTLYYTIRQLSVLYLFSQHVSRYCRVTQKFVNYGTMHLVKKFIVSSSNNIYYIQIHHFTQQTILNQSLYYAIQYLQPNTKSKGVW